MKSYLRNIGLDFFILIIEIYLFFFGKSLLDKPYNVDFKLNRVSDITDIIFNSRCYQEQNLQLWFIVSFVLYMFLYLNMYTNLVLKISNHRSLLLHRYGKTRFLRSCKNTSIMANLKMILLLMIGLVGIKILLTFMGIKILFDIKQFLVIILLFFKLFLTMELLGSLNIYFLLRNNNIYVMICSISFLMLQALMESHIDSFNIYAYNNMLQKVLFIVLYFLINISVYFWCVRSAKKKSMC